MGRRQVPRLSPYQYEPPPDCNLTTAEFTIGILLCSGYSYKKIALKVDRTVSTVRTHAHHIYEKLRVADRGALVLLFIRNGWFGSTPGKEPLSMRFPDIPPFAVAYLDALDRHLKDEDDAKAANDMRIAGMGLFGRKPAPRDRNLFLDRCNRSRRATCLASNFDTRSRLMRTLLIRATTWRTSGGESPTSISWSTPIRPLSTAGST